jgi:hypothetical protein
LLSYPRVPNSVEKKLSVLDNAFIVSFAVIFKASAIPVIQRFGGRPLYIFLLLLAVNTFYGMLSMYIMLHY